jgi:uncharacterized repeat protein (TIGR01451 family)
MDSIKYNDIDSFLTADFAGSSNGTNIDTFPRFRDTLTYNFHLQYHSPCIDRGDPDTAYNDLDTSRNDMGAYGWRWAIDTIMPPQLDSLRIKPGSAALKDSVIWTQSAVGDFYRYGVYRDTVDSFVPAAVNCIDTVVGVASVQQEYDNNGKSYYYKLNVWDMGAPAGMDSLGGGYIMACYGRLQLGKRKEVTGTGKPGDTITYTIFYDNDGSEATQDTAIVLDYIPKNAMYLDTLVGGLYTGGNQRVWWLPKNGTWTLTVPGWQDSVVALKWQLWPGLGAQSSAGDKTGADSLRGTGVDTTTGTDAGRIKFKVRIR